MIRWAGDLELPRRYFAFVLLPVLIVVGGDYLMYKFGWPFPSSLKIVPGRNFAHEEGAARLLFLTSFLLVASASAAVTVYCFSLLARYERRSVIAVIAAAAVAMTIVGLYYWFDSKYQMQELVSQAVHCAASAAPNRSADLGIAETVAERLAAWDNSTPLCEADSFVRMRTVVALERGFLLVAVPSAVFAAILCLGVLPGQKPDEAVDGAASTDAEVAADKQLLKLQIKRLNTVLYLSAFFLVAGVLLASTFLHYPSFALGEPGKEQFERHAQANVLYYAVNYSLLIASFYLPAAAILAGRCTDRMTEEEAEKVESRFMAPLQMVRTGLAIFSPLVAGLLTEVIKLP